jgi:hypothetical protein
MIRIILAIVTLAVVAFFVLHPHSKHQSQNLVTPITERTTGWTHDALADLRVTFSAENDALRVDIPQIDTTDYHVQCYFHPVQLKEGAQYRIRFEAKASNEFVMKLQSLSEWRGFPNSGLDTKVALVTQWVPYSFTFTAHGLNNRTARVPVFLMGTNTGTVWIKNVVLEEM